MHNKRKKEQRSWTIVTNHYYYRHHHHNSNHKFKDAFPAGHPSPHVARPRQAAAPHHSRLREPARHSIVQGRSDLTHSHSPSQRRRLLHSSSSAAKPRELSPREAGRPPLSHRTNKKQEEALTPELSLARRSWRYTPAHKSADTESFSSALFFSLPTYFFPLSATECHACNYYGRFIKAPGRTRRPSCVEIMVYGVSRTRESMKDTAKRRLPVIPQKGKMGKGTTQKVLSFLFGGQRWGRT